MTVIVMYIDSEAEFLADRDEYHQQFLDGLREACDENGDELTPQQFAALPIDEQYAIAEDEMGEDWTTGWVYDAHTIGADRDSAMRFATEDEARAFVAQHFADDDGEFIY